ncbi:glycine-rich domain-containing protein [Flavobacterium sp. I3-2]|uniref:glycine-rich domain-containing protein n=1 Tax=Flavobacterium sp. I3-2 TaxID=2748319 RepID=UPI0015B31A95|nr:hypothetical protein [Flavobacterium sp. I3-2]
MNQELWNRILNFNFDFPQSEFGFTTRLAKENYWTLNFTKKAILEYKKFMYLAATSNVMVSPSEIVDVVWHQHLIFTKSYQKFCTILGKQIQHIPSTHNKEDYAKFKQAKEQTKILYEQNFGNQPEEIWSFNTMFESLKLKKAKYKLRTFINFGIISFVCLILPFYFILNPIYRKIDGSLFIFLLLILSIVIFSILEIYNRKKLHELIINIDKKSFLFDLIPDELIYLKKQNIINVINVSINELIKENVIKISDNKQVFLNEKAIVNTPESYQIVALIPENKSISYIDLITKLKYKPIFSNISNSLDATTKFINKSQKFHTLYYTNFVIISTLILLAFVRIITGLVHSKNIGVILVSTIFLIMFSVFFLDRLTKQIAVNQLPKFYINEIISKEKIENHSEWNYFLLGSSALIWTFKPIAEDLQTEKNQNNSCSSCGTSCGSCGGCSGCGSS